ncbi:MAG: alkaline phosphatase family protein [Candidatus Eisenbacteria bacterium]
MKIDRLLVALICVALAAAAIVFVSKRSPASDEPAATIEVKGGDLSLLVVGVESLDLSIVERLSDEGRLPNLTALMDAGAVGEFGTLGKGVDRKITWTSLVTGITPARQGIGGTKLSPRGDIVKAALVPNSRTVGTLWTALAEAGRPVGVLGWWGSWPVEQIDGIVVAPYQTYFLERRHGGPPERQIYPLDLIEIVDPLVVDPEALSRKDLARYVDTETALGLEALIGQGYTDLANAHAANVSMRDVAVTLASSRELDAELVLLPGIELVSQRFWHMANPDQMEWSTLSEDVTEQVTAQIEALGGVIDISYEVVDEILGDLLELTADGATVAVVSDHGYDGLRYDSRGQPMLGPNMYNEEGFWVLAGPAVRSGVRVRDLSLLDFAPTVAEAAGVVLVDEPDGRACAEMLLK